MQYKRKSKIIIMVLFILIASSFSIADLNDTLTKNTRMKKPTLQICEDSDSNNFFIKGFVNITKGNKTKIFKDYCSENSTLIEYVCVGDMKKEVEENCEYGCSDGKCLESNLITGELILETECEDGTLLDECNEEGFRCIDLELVEDETCIVQYDPIIPDNIGETRYLYAGNKLIGKKVNNDVFYITTDYLGSLRLLQDENQNVVEEHNYYPFGKPIENSGRYTGKEFNENTELYYYGARYYNPETGAFIQKDPIDDSLSEYAYVKNNPLKYIDSDGRKEQKTGVVFDFGWYKNYYQTSVNRVKNSEVYKKLNQLNDFRGTLRFCKNKKEEKAFENYKQKYGIAAGGFTSILGKNKDGTKEYVSIFSNGFKKEARNPNKEYQVITNAAFETVLVHELLHQLFSYYNDDRHPNNLEHAYIYSQENKYIQGRIDMLKSKGHLNRHDQLELTSFEYLYKENNNAINKLIIPLSAGFGTI